jgi:hypothetical protein
MSPYRALSSRTCTITFLYDGGIYAHTTVATSVFEAARNALKFWADAFWQGPRPTRETILQVSITGTETRYKVRAGRVMPTA